MTVQYEPEATADERSLSWLFPQLADSDLTLTEDSRDVRRWCGVVDADTFARLSDVWYLDKHDAGHTFDGMEWEDDGRSPIIWARVTVVWVAALAA